eukprot:scaffold22577_cov122-Cylindrotheca_fusiformis.AAC.38
MSSPAGSRTLPSWNQTIFPSSNHNATVDLYRDLECWCCLWAITKRQQGAFCWSSGFHQLRNFRGNGDVLDSAKLPALLYSPIHVIPSAATPTFDAPTRKTIHQLWGHFICITRHESSI